jgi:hypothetical protein
VLVSYLNQVYRVTGKKHLTATGICKLRGVGGETQLIHWSEALVKNVEPDVKIEP